MFGYSSFDDAKSEYISKYIIKLFNAKEFYTNMIDAIISHLEKQNELHLLRNTLVNKRFIARKDLKLLNDPKPNHNSYTFGEYVQTKKFAKHHKTEPNYEGPFIIAKVFDKNAYKLADTHGNLIKGTYKLQHLRPAFQHYGSPFRSISDFSQSFGQQERKDFTGNMHI